MESIWNNSLYNNSLSEQQNHTNVTLSNVFEKSKNTTSSIITCTSAECIIISVFIHIICIVGIVANFVAILTICLDKKLHRPTFAAICCLSFSDFVFMLSRYIKYILHTYCKQMMSKSTYVAVVRTMDALGLARGKSSIAHIVLLSILRYVVVVHPLQSNIWVTNKRIITASGITWFVVSGSTMYFMYAVGTFQEKPNLKLAQVSNIAITAIWSFLPVIVIISFHIMKAKQLEKSLSACTGKTIHRMSKMVTLIVIAFVVTMTPINIKDILEISFGFHKEEWFVVYRHISRLLLFANYTVNPFIYFVHSPMFRSSVKRLSKMQRKQASYETSSFSTASTKSGVSTFGT